jgi:hypothetical protein
MIVYFIEPYRHLGNDHDNLIDDWIGKKAYWLYNKDLLKVLGWSNRYTKYGLRDLRFICKTT